MRKLFLFLAIPFLLLAKGKAPLHDFADTEAGKIDAPWFTGPLLAPSGVAISNGHYNLEPYFFVIANTGKYNSHWENVPQETFWNNSFQFSAQVGIAPWMDFQLNPTFFYNHTQGVTDVVWGDMPFGFDIQLYRSPPGEITDWNTGLKLSIKEVIPWGKYQNLKPAKLGTDVGGGGSWQTAFGLTWGNLFHLGGVHFLTWRNNFQYTLPAPTRVKNLNTYGGGLGTKGTVYPAQSFQIDTALEIGLSRNWAFAIDFVGNWTGRTRFKGQTTVLNTASPSAQFSIAPALEYNWNSNLGIIFGSWFTIAGRNSTKFISGVFALNYYK